MAEHSLTIADSAAPHFFKGILLHEYLIGALLIHITLQLSFFSQSYKWIAAYVSIFVAYSVLIRWGMRSLSPLINRLRLIANILVVNIVFSSIKYLVPAMGRTTKDSFLAKIDMYIVGKDLSLWVEQFFSKPLTEIMSIGYMLFIMFLTLSLIYYGLFASLEKLCLFCMGLFMLYAVGLTGYTLMPAEGPFIYYKANYVNGIEGYFFTALNKKMVATGSAQFDVFPSLHIGIGLFLLLFYRKHDHMLFTIFFIPFIILSLSTIYLRYHYVIDIVCGIVICLICYAYSHKIYGKMTTKNTL